MTLKSVALFLLLSIVVSGLSTTNTLVSSARASDVGEIQKQIFEQANAGIVRIRVRDTFPFLSAQAGNTPGVGVGTGFLIDAKRGWFLTNAHVAGRAGTDLTIKFENGRVLVAHKIYVDPIIDLAIIAVQPNQMPKHAQALRLKCDRHPSAATPIISFGYPPSAQLTASQGRIVGITWLNEYGNMIQTNARSRNGTSGGPVFNLRDGSVIGVNTAAKRKDKYIHFVTPIRFACRLTQLLKAGKDPSPPDLPYDFLGEPMKNKVLQVARVYPGQNPLKLKEGDIILGVNQQALEFPTRKSFMHLLRGRVTNVSVQIKRQGRVMTVRGTLRPMKKITDYIGLEIAGGLYAEALHRPFNGYRKGLPNILFHNYDKGSLSAVHQINKWDYLRRVNGKPIHSVAQLYCLLMRLNKNDKTAEFEFLRIQGHYTTDQPYIYFRRRVDITRIRIVSDGLNQSGKPWVPRFKHCAPGPKQPLTAKREGN